MKDIKILLLSDSTGETVSSVFNAVKAQYRNNFVESFNFLIRSKEEILKVLKNFDSDSIVIYSFANQIFEDELILLSQTIGFDLHNILKPISKLIENKGGIVDEKYRTGIQHKIDETYLKRIDAISFTVNHDDGTNYEQYKDADIVIIGVSRSSKSPTCHYLAQKGIKAANIPFVGDMSMYNEILQNNDNGKKPFIVGLVCNIDELLKIRKNRIDTLGNNQTYAYTDFESVNEEIIQFKKFCNINRWPVINVTNKSIEEISSQVIKYMNKYGIIENE